MAKTKKPSQDDVLRLGTTIANIKAQADPKAWKALVKRAHSGGFTVAGELSGNPAALKERTQSSLKAQAQKTIDTSYAPASKELDVDQAKITNWDAKRKQDNTNYETWLAAQREKQNTQLSAAATTISAANTAAAPDAAARYSAVQPQGSPAAQAAVDAGAARGVATVKNAADSSQAIVGAGVEHAREMGEASLAQAGAREAQRYADTGNMRKDVLDKKSQLVVGKAKDYLTEFARLTTEQQSIASSNRDASMLADKLQVSQDALDLKTRAQDTTDKKVNADIAATKEANHIKAAAVRVSRNKADYNADGKVDAQDRLDKVQDAKDIKAAGKTTAGKDAVTAGQKTTSVAKIGSLSRVYALLQDLHKNPPTVGKAGEGQGPHKLTPDKFRHYLTGTLKGGASSLMIDLAEDARTHGGRLSAAGRKKARSAGILNPETIQL